MTGFQVFQFFWGLLTLAIWAIYLRTGYTPNLIVAIFDTICLVLISRDVLREGKAAK